MASVEVPVVGRLVAVSVNVASAGVRVVGLTASLGLDVSVTVVSSGAALVGVSAAETLAGEEAS